VPTMQRDWVAVWYTLLLAVWIFSAVSWIGPALGCTQTCASSMIDKDLLAMMLVFMMNTVVFVAAVSLRSSAHRCRRSKDTADEDDVTEFSIDGFDGTESLARPGDAAPGQALPLTCRERVQAKLASLRAALPWTGSRASSGGAGGDAGTLTPSSSGGYVAESALTSRLGAARSSAASPLARPSTFDVEDSPGSALSSAKRASNGGDAAKDEFDISAVSMEMLSLLQLVRQPDELVFMHCGSDAYLYMRFQKYTINIMWVMFLTSAFLLCPAQMHVAEQQRANGIPREVTTFYAWANAGNLPNVERRCLKSGALCTSQPHRCPDPADLCEQTERMWVHLFATYFYSFLVFVWLSEYRRLMVKLTDPTFAQELNSRVKDVQRWGKTDSASASAQDELLATEAQSRTLICKHVPANLSRFNIQAVIDQSLPDYLLAVHVPSRVGNSLWSKFPCLEEQGSGSGCIFLTFRTRAQARSVLNIFKRMHKRAEAKQSLQVDFGAIGTFGINFGIDLPDFVQETINAATDIDHHLDRVLDQLGEVTEAVDETWRQYFGRHWARMEAMCCGRSQIGITDASSETTEQGGAAAATAEPSGPEAKLGEASSSASIYGNAPVQSTFKMELEPEPETESAPSIFAEEESAPSIFAEEITPPAASASRDGSESPTRPSPSAKRIKARRGAISIDPEEIARAQAETAGPTGTTHGDMPFLDASQLSLRPSSRTTSALAESESSSAPWAASLQSSPRALAGNDDEDLSLVLPDEFKAKKWTVQWAPAARDVQWNNLHIGSKQRTVRSIVFTALLWTVFLSISYAYHRWQMESTMATLLVQITKNATGIKKDAMLTNNLNGRSYSVGMLIYGLETIYAPVIVLCVVNYGILPQCINVASYLEGKRKRSSIEKSILRRTFMFMLVLVLLLPSFAIKTPGKFLQNLKAASDAVNSDKSYDWKIGYCKNACRCYGATSFHVCDPDDASIVSDSDILQKNVITDKNPDGDYMPCDDPYGGRAPCKRMWDPNGNASYPTRCYNDTIQKYWDKLYPKRAGKINGCTRYTDDKLHNGEPDYTKLFPVCKDNKVHCHHVTVDCVGDCDSNDYLRIIGGFVLGANAPFMFSFILSASLLGTAWQLMNVAFWLFCLVSSLVAKHKNKKTSDVNVQFWDVVSGKDDKMAKTMKENGFAFELGYYYAVQLVIFAIVLFYSVHFFPITFAGLLYFNCKHFVDKFNMLYVYPTSAGSGHVRSGGQLSGTVYDMVLFVLCLMQFGMACFFYVKDPRSAYYVLYLLTATLGWLVVSLRRKAPVNADVKFGDEAREVLESTVGVPSGTDGGAVVTRVTTAHITKRQISQAYMQPVDKSVQQHWMSSIMEQ
jgi:hypothetical protein